MPATTLTLDDLAEPAPPLGPADWNDDGVVVLPGLIPDDLIRAYEAEWRVANGWRGLSSFPGADPRHGPSHVGSGVWVLDAVEPGGWVDCTPYMRHDALRAICCYQPLADALERLLGEPAGVHLNLTGWVSTERNWHQDGYLNPPEVGDRYAAVWMALEDVHPDSGPFQYVPGSHRWHRLLRSRIWEHVDGTDPQWPKHTEDFLTPLVEAECERRGVEPVSFLPRKGDVLIWHGRLYHRGSRANVPGAYRPSLIAHFSGIRHRPDMPPAIRHEAGGWLFPITSRQPTR